MGYVQFLEEIGRALLLQFLAEKFDVAIIIGAFFAIFQRHVGFGLDFAVQLSGAGAILAAAAQHEKAADKHQCKQYLFHFLSVLVVLTPQR